MKTRRKASESWVPLPEWLVLYNPPFIRCDMLLGPCACGAWHREEHLLYRLIAEIERRKT